MNQEKQNKLIYIVKSFEEQASDRIKKKLDLDLLVRVVNRLDEFTSECSDCAVYLKQFEQFFAETVNGPDQVLGDARKRYDVLISKSKDHLCEKHNLVTTGYYTSIYMALGMSLGLVFGLTVFDNLGLGLPIGLAIGLSVGSAMDADAKKKNKVL